MRHTQSVKSSYLNILTAWVCIVLPYIGLILLHTLFSSYYVYLPTDTESGVLLCNISPSEYHCAYVLLL